MYNDIIIERLENLTNLYALKKANVTILSKKNKFGDIVKFFAQINKDNKVVKITYKATGCSTFIAICSFFCDMVTGKTIEEACNIKASDLEQITILDETKKHVYSVVLDTFDLLIKKYQKGLKNGKIKPIEISVETKEKTSLFKSNHVSFKPIDCKQQKQVSDLISIQDSIKKLETEKINEKIKQENKLNHLSSLKKKINNRENNDKLKNNSKSLTNLINKFILK